MSPLLTVSHLKKSFQTGETRIEVLKDINFTILPGEFVALIGESGSGKSTLLHLLAGLEPADAGQIIYTLSDTHSYILGKGNEDHHAQFRAKFLGFVFQYHHLLSDFTAFENVLLPALLAKKSQSEILPKIHFLFEQLGISHRISHFPNQLSGGEQQRVAIARALINSPLIVLADEPTGNLDPANAQKVLELMKHLSQTLHQTFLVASHSTIVQSFADRVLHLHEGIVSEV